MDAFNKYILCTGNQLIFIFRNMSQTIVIYIYIYFSVALWNMLCYMRLISKLMQKETWDPHENELFNT